MSQFGNKTYNQDYCANCEMHLDDHAPGGKCLFEPTEFRPMTAGEYVQFLFKMFPSKGKFYGQVYGATPQAISEVVKETKWLSSKAIQALHDEIVFALPASEEE